MSLLTFLLTLAAVWIFTGAVSAIVMHRRGHRWFSWMLLGACFGPFVLPLLPIVTGADKIRGTAPIRPGTLGVGDVDIVIGIDGSQAALAAAKEAVRLLGSRIRAATLVTARDFEAANEPIDESALLVAAESITWPDGVEPELLQAHGRPTEALARTADERQALLIIGEHGQGMAPLGLGSVTSSIRGKARGPYLILGGLSDRGMVKPNRRVR